MIQDGCADSFFGGSDLQGTPGVFGEEVARLGGGGGVPVVFGKPFSACLVVDEREGEDAVRGTLESGVAKTPFGTELHHPDHRSDILLSHGFKFRG